MRHKLDKVHLERFSKVCHHHVSRLGLMSMPVTYSLGVKRGEHTPGTLAMTHVSALNNRAWITLASTWPFEPTDNRLDYVALHEALELLLLVKLRGPAESMAGAGFDLSKWKAACHDTLHSLVAWMRPDLMMDAE